MSKKPAEPFELSSQAPGTVPENVVEELRNLRIIANGRAADFREAVKVQSEKHHVKAKALAKFVNALASDHLDATRAEAEDLLRLSA